MYTMTIVLLDEKLLEKIVGILIELEVFNATILDGEAPETVAVESLPVFSELADIMEGDIVYNKTVIAHVPDEKTWKRFISICTQEGIDFDEEDIGWVTVTEAVFFKGF